MLLQRKEEEEGKPLHYNAVKHRGATRAGRYHQVISYIIPAVLESSTPPTYWLQAESHDIWFTPPAMHQQHARRFESSSPVSDPHDQPGSYLCHLLRSHCRPVDRRHLADSWR